MRINQYAFKNNDVVSREIQVEDSSKIDLVFVFGPTDKLKGNIDRIKDEFSNAEILFISAAEVINNADVLYEEISISAIQFEKTKIVAKSLNVNDYEDRFSATEKLLQEFDRNDLSHLLVFADGQGVNGTEIVQAINNQKLEKVKVSGGLASNGLSFDRAMVSLNEPQKEGNIVVVAMYGNSLKVGYGSKGGWDKFGPKRLVTKSYKNELFELDNNNALDLYKTYLGEKAKELPGSALLFPLAIQLEESEEVLVRTILNVDEEKNSMIFAGDIPEGSYVQLMKANFDRLVDAASDAAQEGDLGLNEDADFALLISCIGRRIVLDQKIEDEVEAVSDVLGDNTKKIGFYSYGEISPLMDSSDCQLHNQTMTITVFKEV